MEIEAAKQIGAGIAALALAGAGQFTTLLIGFALTEFTGLLGFVVAMIILFG